MPIYEYVCSVCSHRTDILHGVHDPAPNFCPECGAEGSMRKAFAPPTIVFKGSGWAKRDRRSGTAAKTGKDAAEAGTTATPSAGETGGAKAKDSGSTSGGTTGSSSTGDSD